MKFGSDAAPFRCRSKVGTAQVVQRRTRLLPYPEYGEDSNASHGTTALRPCALQKGVEV